MNSSAPLKLANASWWNSRRHRERGEPPHRPSTNESSTACGRSPHVIDVALTDNLLAVSCEASEHNLTDVLAALRAGNVRMGRITCAPPTLNDVFLEITGRELRD